MNENALHTVINLKRGPALLTNHLSRRCCNAFISTKWAGEAVIQGRDDSALNHWPVQVRLVLPTAPSLKGAHLPVVAECAPVAYPNFHRDFFKGKVVMVGCPKSDGAQGYIQKFGEIFKGTDIKSMTVLVMEVPCCQGLPIIA
jgi:hypothetical protein